MLHIIFGHYFFLQCRQAVEELTGGGKEILLFNTAIDSVAICKVWGLWREASVLKNSLDFKSYDNIEFDPCAQIELGNLYLFSLHIK